MIVIDSPRQTSVNVAENFVVTERNVLATSSIDPGHLVIHRGRATHGQGSAQRRLVIGPKGIRPHWLVNATDMDKVAFLVALSSQGFKVVPGVATFPSTSRARGDIAATVRSLVVGNYWIIHRYTEDPPDCERCWLLDSYQLPFKAYARVALLDIAPFQQSLCRRCLQQLRTRKAVRQAEAFR